MRFIRAAVAAHSIKRFKAAVLWNVAIVAMRISVGVSHQRKAQGLDDFVQTLRLNKANSP